jgi:PTH2 family peptidyl-tRNA hydrolase
VYKQAIVVRKDLRWGKGKLAAQVAHASLGAAMLSPESVLHSWKDDGAKKVVLKADGEKEVRELERLAKKEGLPCFIVRDAGKTQLKSGTVTALGIGPAKEHDVDVVTGKLKLL